jgi:hypothetical protein
LRKNTDSKSAVYRVLLSHRQPDANSTGVVGVNEANAGPFQAYLALLLFEKSGRIAGYQFHPLRGFKPTRYSVHVNGSGRRKHEMLHAGGDDGGEVDDGIDLVIGDQTRHERFIGDIADEEARREPRA